MSKEIMQQALDALMLVGKYTDSLTCYASTISEHEANIVDPSVQSAIAALEAELAKPANEFHPDWDTLKPYHDRIAELEAQLAKPEQPDLRKAAEMALDALGYDPETGYLFWKQSRGTKKAGSIAGTVNGKGYVIISLNRKIYQAHRLAWMLYHNKFDFQSIDHINSIKTDNRIVNLREATLTQNQQNQRNARSDNKSGYLGVCKYKDKWMACIKVQGKSKHIGYFESPELAHEAYLTAKREHHEACTI